MEILILTGKFGMGHWSAALSLQEQLEREGHQVHVMDFFAYALPETAPALYRGFVKIYCRRANSLNIEEIRKGVQLLSPKAE